jgi:hypothetical protein
MDMQRWAAVVGLAGIICVVAFPLIEHERRRRAEAAAAVVLAEVARAQTAFRASSGGAGYASDLESLLTSCSGAPRAVLAAHIGTHDIRAMRYQFHVRAAEGSRVVGTDCHGRPAVSDYYAAAAPRINGVDGRRAFAMRSSARVFVFFDGIPPRESDMGPFGLAVAFNTLDRFKIP